MHNKKILKDINYIELNRDLNYQAMCLTEQQKEEIQGLIEMDSEYLCSQRLMDYSLLVVIETEKK
jgi:hypothetical protein